MDLRVGRDDSDGTPWPVLADLAITMVFVLILHVLAIVQPSQEDEIAKALVRRQLEIKDSLLGLSNQQGRIQVDSLAPDRQRLTFSSEVLFETCRASLKPEGAELLRAVGRVIGRQRGYFESVDVEGHTDRRPIRSWGHDCTFSSNWELSSARATAVVNVFSAEGLIESRLLSAIGRAEYRPVDSLSLDPNRRIEMILQYDRSSIPDRSRAPIPGARQF